MSPIANETISTEIVLYKFDLFFFLLCVLCVCCCDGQVGIRALSYCVLILLKTDENYDDDSVEWLDSNRINCSDGCSRSYFDFFFFFSLSFAISRFSRSVRFSYMTF